MKHPLIQLYHQVETQVNLRASCPNNPKDSVVLRVDIQVSNQEASQDNIKVDSQANSQEATQANSQEATQVSIQAKDILVSIQAVIQGSSQAVIQVAILNTVALHTDSLNSVANPNMVTNLSSPVTNLMVIPNSLNLEAIKATTRACMVMVSSHRNHMAMASQATSSRTILKLRSMPTAMLGIRCNGLAKTHTQEQ
jgi:hypothetical protein